MLKAKLIKTILPCLFLFSTCQQKVNKKQEYTLSNEDCLACERISLFYKAKDLVHATVWHGLNNNSLDAPILYFTDSTTYMTTSNNHYFSAPDYTSINCKNEITLYKLNLRLDSIPFHMENKMSFKDSSSLFYYRPMMLCSDVETMHQFVPDFETTEEWLQLVMHEYFHSFQFSHKNSINYLADSIQIAADTLDRIYLQNKWFQQYIQRENEMLLNAIESENQDSTIFFISRLQEHRNSRRLKFQTTSEFNLSKAENFWETIEGSARYTEYYMALYFTNISAGRLESCDTLFHGFENYSDTESVERGKEFKIRTEIMPAYYYVTGFNMCRLMDKMVIEYKAGLFDKPEQGLYDILVENFDKYHH